MIDYGGDAMSFMLMMAYLWSKVYIESRSLVDRTFLAVRGLANHDSNDSYELRLWRQRTLYLLGR